MSLRAYVQNNFWLKLFSLFLATLIWFSVRFYSKQGFPFTRNPLSLFSTREFVGVPVRVITPPDQTGSFKAQPAYVDVTVSGDKNMLHDMATREILVFVNLQSGAARRAGSNEVQVYTPPGVRLVQAWPSVVRIEHSSLENQ
jgi:hypothetical protein